MSAIRWLTGMLIVVVLLTACLGEDLASPPDPYAPYRPALLEAFSSDFDRLSPLPRYDLELRLDVDTRHLEGSGTVIVSNTHTLPLSELYFRLYPNLSQYQGSIAIKEILVDGKMAAFGYTPDNTAIQVALTEPLPKGESVEVRYAWALDAPLIPAGYALFGESQGILSLPLSYPILAVSEMDTEGGRLKWHLETAPSFSDVAFTESALYQVRLIVDPDMTVITSGTVVSRTTTAEGMAAWQIVTGPIREFMLILSPRFEKASGKAYDTTVHSYFLPEDRLAGQRALAYAIAAVQVYNDRFGRYPFPELNIVEAPLENRGMEYPVVNLIGIDTYRERQEEQEFLIVHEIAHQWWYNLVGNDPVNRPWLDEGLAEYSAYIYFESVYGKEVAERIRHNRWEIPVAYARESGLDTVVGQSAFGFSPLNYEIMVYAKSALFFHALRQKMGDQAFFEWLQALVTDYRYQVLTPEAMLSEAERISGRDVQSVYERWILTAGHP
ncbi:MAG TPA: M1 family metallopeptidase [Caldilineae bacterium]|nr:M1 family metallopeptidase [Caldilineae bacterium]